MASAIEIILIPTLMIVIGYLFKRLGILKPQDSNVLSSIVITVSMPAMIFLNLSKATIHPSLGILPIISIIISVIGMIIAYAYCKSRSYDKIKTWTIMIAAAMMNTGFIGYPITLGVFGEEGLIHAIFFDLVTPILFVAYGMILVREFGGDRKRVIREGLTFMPLWGVIFGLIANAVHFQPGYVIGSTLNYLSESTVPLIMLSLGLTINFRDVKKYMSDSVVVSAIRLLIAPCIVFITFSLLHITGMVFDVSVLESGMSTAMTALVLAITYKLDDRLMSSIILVDVLLSLITLTCWISLIM